MKVRVAGAAPCLLAVFAVLAVLATGCMTVRSISLSQVPERDERRAPVRAHAWSPIILWIPFGSGYIDDARSDLVAQCTDGAIEGLLAKHEVTDYLISLVQTQAVTFEGYCVHGKSAGGGRGKHGKSKSAKGKKA